MRLPDVVPAVRADLRRERHHAADEDVHFTRALARTVVEALSRPGDLVLDPFAGFGTTLEVALATGRAAVGVELLPERADAARARAPGAVVVEGDARGLLALVADRSLPVPPGTVALCLTSPPWMTANDHPANPLTAYETDDGDYVRYLAALAEVARQLRTLLRPGGHVVLDVADLEHEGRTTALVTDVAAAAAAHLEHVATVPVVWDEPPAGVAREGLVVLRRPPGDRGSAPLR